MKKQPFVVALTSVLLLTTSLTGCSCNHDWQDATCVEPKTCLICGETEGEKSEHSWIDATYTEPKTCSVCGKTEGTVLEQVVYENMPEGLSVNENEWENWKSQNVCSLFPFMTATQKVNFAFTIPSGQDKNHKVGKFVFTDNDTNKTLENAQFYYGVEKQDVFYVGLYTDNETVYEGTDFKEACIRMMMSYNIHYDSTSGDSKLNLTRERAEEIVSFCYDNEIEHCIADEMRIRLVRNSDNNYYSFHIEY